MDQPMTPITMKPRSGPSILSILLALGFLVAVGGVAFAAGRLTAPTTTGGTRFANGQGGGFAGGQGGQGGAFGGGNGGAVGGLAGAAGLTVHGTVSSVTATSITLTLASGTTVTIPTSTTTTYHRQDSAAQTDVKVGSQVLVQLAAGQGIGRGGLGGGQGGGAAASPGASPGAQASPGAGTSRLGPAQDVTVVSS